MSNHFSADYLKSPGDDRRLDITDVYVFRSSKDPDKMMLIVNSNPTAPAPAPIQARGPEFYQVLPDILRYDRTKAPLLPQRPQADRGRLQLPLRLAQLRQGPPARPQPHADLLTDFPYLGPPNP